MTNEGFHVELVGHACLRIRTAGRTLLTDPWLLGPVGRFFHYPPLVHDPAAVAADVTAIYLSHIHPDHFHPPSLNLFSRETPVYIGRYDRPDFADAVRRLGFRVVELPFRVPVRVPGTDFEVAIVEHDYEESAAYDSALVVRTPEFTLFENNDCFLNAEKYAWVRDNFAVDYAFLGYSPASYFPILFEMEAAEKERLLRLTGERKYAEFLRSAAVLGAKLTVPFASGARFLRAADLWKNVSFNAPAEALERLRARGLQGAWMCPGDAIAADGSVRRHPESKLPADEIAAIADYAAGVREEVEDALTPLLPARADLVERFRDHILGLWHAGRGRLSGVRECVIAYHLDGGEHFYFDFSRPEDEIFRRGDPPRYDMRYRYPADALQMKLDGAMTWDDLHFSYDVSVHQVRYARDFYRMLRGETLDSGLGAAPQEVSLRDENGADMSRG